MKRTLLVLLGILACGIAPVHAQTFPSRPVTLIVPFPPGGPSDALGRMVVHAMTGPLGQQIIVENVGGAGGTLGAAKGAQARPDGYTLLLAHVGQATSVSLYRKLPYHPVESFDAVGMIGEVPMTIVGRKDLPVRDIGELIAHVKANGKNVSYANAGTGSASHLCGLLFMSALQTEMNVISYRGSGPAMTDVLGQRIDLSVWYGVVAPKGVPKAALDRLAAALHGALEDPAFLKRLADAGAQPATRERASPDKFGAFLRADAARWSPVIKAAGVYAD